MSWFVPQVGNHCSRGRYFDWTVTLKFLFKRKELITWFGWHLSQLYIKLIPTSQRVECITITKTNYCVEASVVPWCYGRCYIQCIQYTEWQDGWDRLPQVTHIQSCDIIKLPTSFDCLELYILKHPVVPIWNHTLTWKLTLRTKTRSSTLPTCLRTAWRLSFSFSKLSNAKNFTKTKPRQNTLFRPKQLQAYRLAKVAT
jgi:hypothetical protein